jgi:outer membrane lipoprotein-sorting protein
MKIKLIGVVCFSLIACSVVSAQPDANQTLSELQSKFDSIEDLTADIIQSVGGKTNLNGKIFYMKENKLRFEFDNILIVSDGETSWNYNKKEKKVIITNYETEGTNILSIEELIYDYPEECEINAYEFEDQTVLEFVPDNSTLNFSSIKLWINSENLVTRALFEDPATDLIQIDLSGYKINSALPESYFSFTPPAASEIIDLR